VVVTESNSEHPIGKSIIQQICIHNDIKTEGISVLEFKAISGSGVTAKVTKDGTSHIIAIGNLELMDTMKCSISIHQRETISDQQYLGHTVVVAAIDDSIICIISLADKIRPEAKRVIKALTKMGISSCMVTGDCLKTAQIIAEKCGISEVYASISPAGKRAIVLNFQDAGLKVAMVGDGVNDSASLAQSDLGIAVFGGTDVAIESASVVLMRPDLTDIVTAIDLSRTIYKRICFNFIWASGYNVLMIPLAMGAGAAWGFTLPAMASGMAMSFSSVSVLVSSLLLQYYRKPQIDLDGLITRPLANLNPLNEDGPLMASDFSKDGIPELRTEIADSTTALL
jgi:Cu+-exporting ATPase